MQRPFRILLPLLAFVLVAAFAGASVAAGQDARGGDGQASFAPREVIVRYDPGVTGAERAHVREDVDAASVQALPLARVELLRLEPGRAVTGAVSELRGHDEVQFAQPNYLYEPDAIPNDPLFSSQWMLHNTGQSGGAADADVDAPEAWDVSTGGDSVVIGIIDTGVNVNHPDLAPNVDPRGRDFFGPDDNVVDDDFEEHGTFVASIAAARGANGQGMSGVAQRAKILPLQADNGEGLISTNAVVESVAYAKTAGARVVNMSFGSYGVPDAGDAAMKAAIESAPEILFTASAGNDGTDNDVTPHWPSNLSKDHANVISVASTNRSDALSGFSSYGATTVDLAAPGESVLGADAMTTAYGESFDGVAAPALPAGWSTGGTSSWATTSTRRNSAPNSLSDSPGVSYANNADSHATSPSIPLPAGGNACKARNVSRVVTASAADHFLTQVALGGSSSFSTISDETGSVAPSFEPAEPGFTYPASTSSLQLRFRLTSDLAGTADGVEVDDVRLLCNHPNPNAFATGSGTSYSSPAVAGAAAVLLGRDPGLTAAELKTTLKQTVDPLASLAGRTVTGGRLNLDRAVRAVTVPAPSPAPSGGGEPAPPTTTTTTTATTPAPPAPPTMTAPATPSEADGPMSLPADETRPVLARLALAPTAFRPLRAGATIRAAATARGARLRFRVSERSTVRVRVLSPRPGRRNARGACVAPTRSNRSGARCTRWLQVRSATRISGRVEGVVSRTFSGRIGGRALAPGTYLLELRATDAAGNRSAPRRTRFRIVRR
ncbi:MAG TPA: S8 family serine peptidase [Solirubrobacteraceae bacterium]|nr:S8 family serine peptidase [Solirubrobacteraceae bacterium]